MAWSLDSVLNMVEKAPAKALKKLDPADLDELPDRLREVFAARRPDGIEAQWILRLAHLTDRVDTLPIPELGRTLAVRPYLPMDVFRPAFDRLDEDTRTTLFDALQPSVLKQLMDLYGTRYRDALLPRVAPTTTIRALLPYAGSPVGEEVLWSQRDRIEDDDRRALFTALPSPARPDWLPYVAYPAAEDFFRNGQDAIRTRFGPAGLRWLQAWIAEQREAGVPWAVKGRGFWVVDAQGPALAGTEDFAWVGPFPSVDALLASLDARLAATGSRRDDDHGDLVSIQVLTGDRVWGRTPEALVSHEAIGFRMRFAEDDPWGNPVGYVVRTLRREGDELVQIDATAVDRPIHPDDGLLQAAEEVLGVRDGAPLVHTYEEIGVVWP